MRTCRLDPNACQPHPRRDLAGVQLADVRIGVLVDHRHRLLGGASALLGRVETSLLEGAVPADPEDRQRVLDRLLQFLGCRLRQVDGVLAVGAAGDGPGGGDTPPPRVPVLTQTATGKVTASFYQHPSHPPGF